MSYLLITGATGLLGSYLLRDALRRDWPVAVIARPAGRRSARERIDAVLAPWESERNLPRPVVLEGDLTQPLLGLNSDDQQWLARNCRRVLHSAASISFYRDEASGEPFRSNVEGTRHLLELCQRLDMRQFHHVSTAYVCGLRRDRVLETDLDIGQSFGNDYEQSKVAAEKLVRSASWLPSATIYRPSIIVGDSQTGYTSTFHGYYTPLQVCYWLARNGAIATDDNRWFIEQLQLRGTEHKNLVPVDWVSHATLELVQREEHHGKTYHLTNPDPPSVQTIADAITAGIQEQLRHHEAPPPSEGAQALAANFRAQMETYRAYFRDDPQFDQTNVATALPGARCPRVDEHMLLRTGRFALQANFLAARGPVRAAPIILETLVATLPKTNHTNSQPLVLEVTGPGGGTITLNVTHGTLSWAQNGRCGEKPTIFRLRSDVFAAILQEKVTLEEALRSGRVYFAAPSALAESYLLALAQWFRHLRQQGIAARLVD